MLLAPMDVREEAQRIHRLLPNDPGRLVELLAGQVATVKAYAQILVGLCGLTITVTGFSGAHMIRSGSIPAGLMVGGIAFVLIGLVVCIRTITTLRWVTQELRDDLVETAVVVIERRNAQQRAVGRAAVFVAVGLALYLGAVSTAAVLGGSV
jgi:hypothetical protein